MSLTNWDYKFLALASHISQWSKDPSTQCGAVIASPQNVVLAMGYNGFPVGMEDRPEYYADREVKLSRIVHAEMNALVYAGKLPEDATLYTQPIMPCDRCCVVMLQAGIRRFVAPQATTEQIERWGDAFSKTRKYILECGGELVEYYEH